MVAAGTGLAVGGAADNAALEAFSAGRLLRQRRVRADRPAKLSSTTTPALS